MSQYGANQMAAEGASYREILTHYYTGVTVEPYVPAGGGLRLYKDRRIMLKYLVLILKNAERKGADP